MPGHKKLKIWNPEQREGGRDGGKSLSGRSDQESRRNPSHSEPRQKEKPGRTERREAAEPQVREETPRITSLQCGSRSRWSLSPSEGIRDGKRGSYIKKGLGLIKLGSWQPLLTFLLVNIFGSRLEAKRLEEDMGFQQILPLSNMQHTKIKLHIQQFSQLS